MTKIARFGILLSCMAGVVACSEARRSQAFQVGDRVVRELTDTVAVVGGSAQDTLLFTPTMIAFLDEDIAVWDRDRSEVLVFSSEGDLRWRYGGKGGGPGEFAGVTQIAADDQNRLWVLDPDNVRISILSRDGRLVRAFRPPDVGHVDRLVPIGRGEAMLTGMDPTLHVIDEEGRLLRTVAHPYASYGTLHPISAYNRAVHDRAADSTAFFFYYGGGFARTDRTLASVAMLTSYVENIPFPEVTVQRTENADGSVTTSSSVNASRLAVKSGSADEGVLYLLFQGDTEYGNRLVDRYSIGSGEYLGSWLLPDSARAIAVAGELVATLVENPYPAMVVRRAPEE